LAVIVVLYARPVLVLGPWFVELRARARAQPAIVDEPAKKPMDILWRGRVADMLESERKARNKGDTVGGDR
jgi:hypothetical protein